jgi:hypothetical protein
MPGAVYLLCSATALLCAALLLRAFWRNRTRLLLWSGLCFVGLALDNVFLFTDLIVFPHVDLSVWRSLPALAGLSLLLYGLIWDAR